MSVSRVLLMVFAAALALRLAYVLGLYFGFGPDALLSSDSYRYTQLAKTFVESGQFDETKTMPLYVLYVAAHFAIAGSSDPLFPALTQSSLDAASCVIIALIARRVRPNLVLPAGLFAAACPTLIVLSGIIYTDGLFLLLASAGLLATLRWLHAPDWRATLMLGGVLALALATRVMILPWIFALPILMLVGAALCRRFAWRAVAQGLLVVAIALAVQAPILVRNITDHDSWKLTSQGGAHALLWLAPLVREGIDGTPHEAGAAELSKQFDATQAARSDNSFVRSSAMTAMARDELARLGLGAIARAWGIGAAINLGAPAIILSPPVSSLPRTGFYDTPGASKLVKVWNFLFRNDNPAYAWILIVSVVGVGVVRLIQLYGFARLLATDRQTRVALLALTGWVLYILLINGPIATAKYRLPIEPAMAVFFAYGITRLSERWRGRQRGIIRRSA